MFGKRGILIVLLTMTAVSMSFSADRQDFDAIVDMDMSLASLARTISADPSFRSDDILLLDGAVNSFFVFDRNPETFYAELELVAGTWDSLSELNVHRALFIIEAPEFAPRFPERLPRNPGPEIIQNNQNVLIVCSLLDVVADQNGEPLAVLIAHYIRSID